MILSNLAHHISVTMICSNLVLCQAVLILPNTWFERIVSLRVFGCHCVCLVIRDLQLICGSILSVLL
jgi:hypothetical protein